MKFREDFTITEKAPSMAFSWLKVPSRAVTFAPASQIHFYLLCSGAHLP